MKETAIVVWSAVLAFLGGGAGTFIYLLITERERAVSRTEDPEFIKQARP